VLVLLLLLLLLLLKMMMVIVVVGGQNVHYIIGAIRRFDISCYYIYCDVVD